MAQELEFETKTLVFLDEFHALHTFFKQQIKKRSLNTIIILKHQLSL